MHCMYLCKRTIKRRDHSVGVPREESGERPDDCCRLMHFIRTNLLLYILYFFKYSRHISHRRRRCKIYRYEPKSCIPKVYNLSLDVGTYIIKCPYIMHNSTLRQ